MINKVSGTKFENDLCKMFSRKGFWCRPMYPAPDGSQPFDVMMINSKGLLICLECKDCKNDIFPLERVEANQVVGLERLMKQYNLWNRVFFAFNTSVGAYFVDASYVLDKKYDSLFAQKAKKSLSLNDIMKKGKNVDEFMEYVK